MRALSNFVRASLLAALVTALTPPFAAAQRGTLEPLRLSYVPANSIYWDIDVAIEKGYFREAGFAPETLAGQGALQMMQMLIAGSVHLASSQPEPIITAVERGAKELGIIAAPADRPDWFLVARPEIKAWKDIKGKTLGFGGIRTGEYWLTRDILAQHGVKPADYDSIVVGLSTARYAALEKGSIAAAILFQPTAELAARKGYTVLAHMASIKSHPAIVLVVSRNWAGTQDHGKRLAEAIKQAHAWLYDPKNRDEAITILAKYTKRDRDILEEIYKLYFVTDKLYSKNGSVDAEGLARLVSLMTKNGETGTKTALPAESYLLPASLGGMAH